MKINKLKAFFISCFIALLIPLSAINTPNITASALTPTAKVYPPKETPSGYNFEYYNHCGSLSDDKLLLAFESKSIFILFANENGTFLTTFDKDCYKKQEIKILDNPCIKACLFDSKIFLIDNSNLFVFDLSYTLINTITLTNAYDIKVINDEIFVFCLGEFGVSLFDYGKIISCQHTYINNYDDYYIFKGQNEIMISNLQEHLFFEIDNFVSASVIDNNLIFATKKDNEIIITSLNGLEIVFTTILPLDAQYVDFESQDNGIYIYLTTDKTYRYFVCNHGDVITNDTFSDKKFISVSANIYEDNSYIYITLNNKQYTINNSIYANIHYFVQDHIIFEYSQDFETYGKTDIYIAKSK